MSGEGKESDVTVLVHERERLVFVFNETKSERRFEIEHLDLGKGMACVDWLSKTQVAEKHCLVSIWSLPTRKWHF